MAQSKAKRRATSSGGERSSAYDVALTLDFDNSKATVHVSCNDLPGVIKPIEKLLRGYLAVAKKAKKAGHPLDYIVRVSPNGLAKALVACGPGCILEGDALGAALAEARKRGQARVGEILKGDDMLTALDFGALIGASHETVNVKRGRGEVLGLQGSTRAVRYPRWQVTDAGLPLPGLPKLFEIFGRQPWTVYRFLRTGHAELGGRTALDALKAGRLEAVLNVAQNQNSGVFS